MIKEKADLINNKKFKNNQLMDDLVQQLGYMDYRDALAMNKYILEAKRHGDYHQQARARTLTLALNRMNRLKREEIDIKVNQDLQKDNSEDKNKPGYKSEKKL